MDSTNYNAFSAIPPRKKQCKNTEYYAIKKGIGKPYKCDHFFKFS